ncbi:MAG: hypothetical protein AAF871_10340 [Pseudomonadota bacterium]
MMKALLVPVLATGLAFGSAPRPAEAAEAGEVAAIIGALVIAGAVIASQNRAEAQTSTRNVTVNSSGRPFGLRSRNAVLPETCLRRFETRRGVRSFAGARCLERAGINTARLPNDCEVLVRTNRGLREAFRQRCLERDGFRFGQRARGINGVQVIDGQRVIDGRRVIE